MAAVAGRKSLRARGGVPLRPPCALACRAARSSRRQARPPAGSRHSIVLSRWRLAPPVALCRRRPARPVVLRAAAVGGLASGGQKAARFAPRRSRPAPRFSPGAGRIGLRCGGYRCSGRDAARPLHVVHSKSPSLSPSSYHSFLLFTHPAIICVSKRKVVRKRVTEKKKAALPSF